MELFENETVPDDIKDQLMDKYPSLTEEDFKEEDHRKLLIHLRQKLGKSKDEMRKIIRDIQ